MVCPMPDFETVEFLLREDVSPTPNPHLPQNLSAWVSLPVEFTAASRRRNPAKYFVNKVAIPSREIVLIRVTYSHTCLLTYLLTYLLYPLTYFTHSLYLHTYLLTCFTHSHTYILTYVLTYFLSYSLHRAESFLRSKPVLS